MKIVLVLTTLLAVSGSASLEVHAQASLQTDILNRDKELPDRSMNQALDAAFLKKIELTRLKLTLVLFTTNRYIEPQAEEKARLNGTVLRYEDMFLNKFGAPFRMVGL